MATKNVGTLNWQTAVDLGGLKKDLKAAEGEMQKSSRRVIASDPAGRLPPRVGGMPMVGRAGVAGGGAGAAVAGNARQQANQISAMLAAAGQATGMGATMGRFGGAVRLGGGAGAAAAPLASMYAGYKAFEVLADFGDEMRKDRLEARRLRMGSQDYLRMAGKAPLSDQTSAALSGLGYGRGELVRAGGRGWATTKAIGAKAAMTYSDMGIMGGLNYAMTGQTTEERFAAAGRKKEEEEMALRARYKNLSGLASRGPSSLIENGMGQHRVMVQEELMKQQAGYTQKMYELQVEAKGKGFNTFVTAEGPA